MRTCFTWRRKWQKSGDVFAERKVTLSGLMNSNKVKSEQFYHLHLVYHFTVPLKITTPPLRPYFLNLKEKNGFQIF